MKTMLRYAVWAVMLAATLAGAAAQNVDEMRRRADAGDMGAMYLMGVWAAEGRLVPQSPEESVRWMRQCADNGSAMAMYALGMDAMKGYGMPLDQAEAFRRFQKSAEMGLDQGQVLTGLCYQRGIGVDADPSEAQRWWLKAAEQKFPGAYPLLGRLYSDPALKMVDVPKGVEWMERAALHGDAESAWHLFAAYGREDNSVNRDVEKALSWLYLAAAGGNEDAVKALAKLDQTVDQRILDTARERAREYQKQIAGNLEAFADRMSEDFRKYAGLTDEDLKLLDRATMKGLISNPEAYVNQERWNAPSGHVEISLPAADSPTGSVNYYAEGIRLWSGRAGATRNPIEGLAYLYAAASLHDAEARKKLSEIEAKADLAVRLSAKTRSREILRGR